MNVLSLFDGISCGRVALERAGIPIEKYYASEIDKYAIQVSKKNFPGIVHLGDIRNWKQWDIDFSKIDLVMGGSPCQGFSNAGTKDNFSDPRSSLFFIFVEIWQYVKSLNKQCYVLLENVKMKKDWVDKISFYMELDPILINSSLVSAQNRERYYWTNIPDVSQPENLNILLESVLLEEVNPKYFLSQKERIYMDRTVADGRSHWDFAHHSDTDNEKSSAVVANFLKGVPYNVLIDRRTANCPFWDCDFQDQDESFCSACDGGDMYQGEGYTTSIVRKFDPVECEKLQTLDENYTAGCSNTQRYKMIGNGWTVDVIASILRSIKI